MIRAYIDTETSGIPDMHQLPSHREQPNLVQIAIVLVETRALDFDRYEFTERAVFSAIVKPDGWTIPASASAVHGITTIDAVDFGLPLRLIVPVISNMLRLASEVVAHNFPFDERIINTAFHRYKETTPCPWPYKRACTMEMAEPILKMPSTPRMLAAGVDAKYKRPSLDDCTKYFFRRAPTKHHNALADVRDCIAIHRALLEGRRKAPWYRGFYRGT